jgi:rod shape determining protein RodA
MLQPDLGSSMVILGIWGIIVLVSGIPKKYIAGIFMVFGLAIAFSWIYLLQPYQKERIFNFLDPTRDIRGSGYNVYQSMIAVGSGGLWGKGINQGSQSKLSYLPEYETDFIFAAFSEEWGYIGVVLCILTFTAMILMILYKSTGFESNFEVLVATGFVAYLMIHTGVNIGMNIGLLPVTGIPLPFMSSGGTHILVEWILVGYIISSTKNKKRVEYGSFKEF